MRRAITPQSELPNIVDFIKEFIEDSGLSALIGKLIMPGSFSNEYDDVKEVNSVVTITEGNALYLNDKTGKCANIKFTGDGKYVVEKGASVVLGPMFKLEGNGTIIELKEGSLIKFTESAKGYEVPSDTEIVLKGKYTSYCSVENGNKDVASDNLGFVEVFSVDIIAQAYCDLEGTVSIGDMEITGGNDREFNLDLKFKGGLKAESIEGSVDASLKVPSITLTNGGETLKVNDLSLGVSASIGNATGIGLKLDVGATIILPNNDSATISANIDAKATYDKEAEQASLTANVGFSIALKSGDTDAKIDVSFSMDGKKDKDQVTAKVSANLNDFTTPTMEAKGVKMDLELKGSMEDFEKGDIEKIISSFYAGADRIRYTDSEKITFDASNITAKMDLTGDVPKLIVNIGSVDAHMYESTIEIMSVSGKDLTATIEKNDDTKATVEGKSADMKVSTMSYPEFSASANDFKVVVDDGVLRLVSGSYDIKGDASVMGTDIEIQKDVRFNFDTLALYGSELTVSFDNEYIDGTFLLYPGSEFECGEIKVVISGTSLGILSVEVDSESKMFLVKPLTGYDLVEPTQGLEYTVREDGYGEFKNVPMNGTLIAAGEFKSYDLTINGETSKQKFMDSVKLPDAPVGKDGYTFYKWTDGYLTYGAGSSFIMPARDVTITALWIETAQKTEADKKITIFGESDSISIKGADISDALQKLKDKTVDNLEIKSGTSKIVFDEKSAQTLSGFTENGLSATVKQADKSAFDEKMTYVVGNGALYSIDLTDGTDAVHTLDGTAKVTVVYDLNGQKISDLKVFYYDNGSTEAVKFTAVSIGDDKAEVTMELTHFSDYVIKAQSDGSSSGDDNGMTVGVIAAIIVASIIAIGVIAFVAIKRKG